MHRLFFFSPSDIQIGVENISTHHPVLSFLVQVGKYLNGWRPAKPLFIYCGTHLTRPKSLCQSKCRLRLRTYTITLLIHFTLPLPLLQQPPSTTHHPLTSPYICHQPHQTTEPPQPPPQPPQRLLTNSLSETTTTTTTHNYPASADNCIPSTEMSTAARRRLMRDFKVSKAPSIRFVV